MLTHYAATVSSKGQIVIPAELREKFGIHAGSRIQLVGGDDEIQMIPMSPELIGKWRGFAKTKGRLTKALLREREEERKR